MRFAEPNFIFAALAILLLAIFYFWVFQARRKAQEKFAQPVLLKELLAYVDPNKQKLKSVLIVSAVALSLFALMRPQWGFHWQEVHRKGLDILIALDTSKSMLAEDVLPNRLERSKLAIRDLVKDISGDRIGLIAFAGSAFLECPLTIDYNGFLLALDDISVNTIPKGGTSISGAIDESLSSYAGGENKYKILVLITDGEDLEGDPLGAAEEAKKEGITIFCIGIGSKEGDLIPITDEGGQRTFLKDKDGLVVKTRLDEGVLEKIALTTGGTYLRSTATEFGLDLLYRQRLSKMERRDIEGKMAKHYDERFQIPLAVALFLFLLESLISDTRK